MGPVDSELVPVLMTFFNLPEFYLMPTFSVVIIEVVWLRGVVGYQSVNSSVGETVLKFPSPFHPCYSSCSDRATPVHLLPGMLLLLLLLLQ